MEVLSKFIKTHLSSNHKKEKTDDLVKYYDDRLEVIMYNNEKMSPNKIMVVHKTPKGQKVIYNNLNVADKNLSQKLYR
jgi:hypothetical protein